MKTTTLDQIVKRIESENAAFEAMTPAQKRMAIARDLIDRVSIGQLKGKRSEIVSLRVKVSKDPDKSVKDLLNTCTDVVCDVCAKGGLLMAYIGRVNQKSILDLKTDVYDCNNSRNGAHKKLAEIFEIRQLAYIEMAFEGNQYMWWDGETDESIHFSSEEKEKAIDFKKQYPKVNERLMAIAENIIANEGTFTL